jgi:hypothetical protein
MDPAVFGGAENFGAAMPNADIGIIAGTFAHARFALQRTPKRTTAPSGGHFIACAIMT